MSDVFNSSGGFGQLKDRIGTLAAARLVYMPKPFPVFSRRARPVPPLAARR